MDNEKQNRVPQYNKNIFSFKGRINRKIFISIWIPATFIIIFCGGGWGIFGYLNTFIKLILNNSGIYYELQYIMEFFYGSYNPELIRNFYITLFPFAIIFAYIIICALIKRLRDMKWHPLLSILGLIPFISFLIIIPCMFIESNKKQTVKKTKKKDSR